MVGVSESTVVVCFFVFLLLLLLFFFLFFLLLLFFFWGGGVIVGKQVANFQKNGVTMGLQLGTGEYLENLSDK